MTTACYWCQRLSIVVTIGLMTLGSDHPELFANDIEEAIQAIQQVDAKGSGHEAAVKAMQRLNQCKVDQVPRLLLALDDANPLGQNWLRSAINRAVARGGELPVVEVRAYFDDRSHSHLGRLLAFELLTSNDPGLADQLIATLHDDPSLPLRRMGIKSLVKKSEDAEPIQKIGMLGFALNHARDVDQIQSIKKALSATGIQVDLTRQLGYFSEWHLVGPFDNRDQKGFDVAFGPEKQLDKVDLTATYEDGIDSEGNPAEVTWKKHSTLDELGVVDLNQVIGNLKGVSVYAYTEFDSDVERDAEIRIGCINANKVWVNGNLVISNEIYHVGMMPDQFSGKTRIKKGVNQILFKVCQNEMSQAWAQRWMFQLRICDHTGKAIAESAPEPTGSVEE